MCNSSPINLIYLFNRWAVFFSTRPSLNFILILILYVMFDGLLSGLFNLIGTGITNSSSEDIAQQTNQTNILLQSQANATNMLMNAENNAFQERLAAQAQQFQKDESELAYQRSKPSQQISNLVESGMTYEQAKQIVAANGSAAAYTPAAGVVAPTTPAQVAAPSVQPYSQNWQGIGETAGAVGSMIDSAFTSADGGSIGNMMAAPIVSDISEHIHEVPKQALASPQDFLSWAHEQDDDHWAHDIVNSDKFRQMAKSLPAIRAFQSQFRDGYAAMVGSSAVIQNSLQGLKLQKIQIQRAEIERDMENIDFETSKLRYEADKFNIPLQGRVAFLTASAAIEECAVKLQSVSDPKYKKVYAARLLQDEQTALIVGKALELQKSAQNEWLNDPANKSLYACGSMLKEAGLTDTLFGEVFAWMQASGIEVQGYLKHFGEWIQSNIHSAVEVTNAFDDLFNHIDNAYQHTFHGQVSMTRHNKRGKALSSSVTNREYVVGVDGQGHYRTIKK